MSNFFSQRFRRPLSGLLDPLPDPVVPGRVSQLCRRSRVPGRGERLRAGRQAALHGRQVGAQHSELFAIAGARPDDLARKRLEPTLHPVSRSVVDPIRRRSVLDFLAVLTAFI